jgi:hypothetical protein
MLESSASSGPVTTGRKKITNSSEEDPLSATNKKREREEHPQLRPLLPVATAKPYAPLRIVKVSSKMDQPDPASSRDGAHQKKTIERPPPTVLTSPVNHFSFRKEINRLLCNQFSLRTTAAAVRIVSHSVTGYKALLYYLSQNTLYHFTSYPNSDKPVKAVVGHLSVNTSSEDTTLVIQVVGSNVLSVKK